MNFYVVPQAMGEFHRKSAKKVDERRLKMIRTYSLIKRLVLLLDKTTPDKRNLTDKIDAVLFIEKIDR